MKRAHFWPLLWPLILAAFACYAVALLVLSLNRLAVSDDSPVPGQVPLLKTRHSHLR